MAAKGIVDFVDEYLSGLKGVESYVIASEGLPIKWSSNLSQEQAEELIALATDLITSASRFGSIVDVKNSFVSVNSAGKAITTLSLGDIQIVAEGDNRVLTAALQNIKAAIEGNPVKCPHCGEDISLAVFKCPHCGSAIPLGLRRCPHCGKVIKYLKCPKCGNPITPFGKKLVYARPKFETLLGAAILGVGAVTSALLYFLGGSDVLPLVPIPAIALAVIAGYVFSIKELIEVEE